MQTRALRQALLVAGGLQFIALGVMLGDFLFTTESSETFVHLSSEDVTTLSGTVVEDDWAERLTVKQSRRHTEHRSSRFRASVPPLPQWHQRRVNRGKDPPSFEELARQHSSVQKPKLRGHLKVTFQTHLGFNNMRFQLETALYLAHNQAACSASPCSQAIDNDDYWCPISLFFDTSALSAVGATPLLDEGSLTGYSWKVIPSAFDKMYSDTALWLERLPHRYRDRLDDIDRPPLTYHLFDLGCELSYNKHYPSEVVVGPKGVAPFGLIDELGNVTASVLELEGSPISIGKTPIVWSSVGALKAFTKLRVRSIQYNPVVRSLGDALAKRLGQLQNGTFVCVHLRLGDFAKLGWSKANNLSKVAETIQAELNSPLEPVYVATDSTDRASLAPLAAVNSIVWDDIRKFLTKEEVQSEQALLQFEDWVGLVEQRICASKFLLKGLVELGEGTFTL